MTPCVIDDCERPVVTRADLVLCSMHGRRVRRTGVLHGLTEEDRFFRHVTEDSAGCWNYTPVDADSGYATFGVRLNNRPTTVGAHRWAYELLVGEIPAGLELDHLCSNRGCVNPDHLDPVPHRVNTLRGVGSRTTCSKGHPYDTSNTEIHARGHRQCRICRQTREQRALIRVPAQEVDSHR